MPKHITRLLLLMVTFGIVAIAAKHFFTVDSYYLYGHYRGNSVADIASDKPKFTGNAYCLTCHEAQSTAWSKSVHNAKDKGKKVNCEVCHGAGASRDRKGPFENVATGPEHPKNLKLTSPSDINKTCTLCHEKMAGRPAQQPQIDVSAHTGTLQCTVCHDVHSPRTIAGSLAADTPAGDAAAGKTAAAVCAGCHATPIAPALDGQRPAYVAAAVHAYKSGERDNKMMQGIVAAMGDSDVQNVAAYYGSLNCKGAPAPDQAEAAAGQALAANCVMCHGAGGVSRQPLWPQLAGLSKDYTLAALKSYRDGTRKSPLMSTMAKGLNDADMTKLAAYFASTGCKANPQ